VATSKKVTKKGVKGAENPALKGEAFRPLEPHLFIARTTA
jgi:hypothetical protein